MLDSFIIVPFFDNLLVKSFEKRLFASTQIIKPMIMIDRIKIYWWLKLIKINSDNRIIEVISLFNKFSDIKYFQNFS